MNFCRNQIRKSFDLRHQANLPSFRASFNMNASLNLIQMFTGYSDLQKYEEKLHYVACVFKTVASLVLI